MRSLVTLLVLFAFACATVRVPAGSVENAPPPEGVMAEPQVELWLEGGSPASAGETALAQREAREALAVALAQKHVQTTGLDAQDPVIVVRERSVARTPARQREQLAARIGMAVGIVAVAAAAVVLAVVSRKGGTRSAPAAPAASSSAGRSAARTVPVAKPASLAKAGAVAKPAAAPKPFAGPRPVGAPVTPTRARPVPAQGPRAVPLGPSTAGKPHFAPGPYLGPPGVPYAGPWGFGAWEMNIGVSFYVPFGSDSPPAEPPLEPAPPPDAPADALPPPPPPPLPALPEMERLDLAKRGFFTSDETLLEVDVVDRATGRVVWTGRARSGADPRDRGDVKRLLDHALEDLPREVSR